VERSVPPTDLTVKGGDDRNISVYFVFAGPETTRRAQGGSSLRRVLKREDVRVLLYTFGGETSDISFTSPHLDSQGLIMVRQMARTGTHSEDINLRADLEAVYGVPEYNLIGVAVSADSDDTDGSIRATLSDLILR
jgi:hypothetical protein